MPRQHEVSPSEDFYRRFAPAQIEAVLDALTQQRPEFPYELTYLGDGGGLWRELEEESTPYWTTALRDLDTMLERHAEELLALAPPSAAIRLVDLGPGTARPIRGLLRHLLDRSRCAGYRAIDISDGMLELARRTLRTEFPDQVDGFELIQGDFGGPDLTHALPAGEPGVRFVVATGGTLYNFADPSAILRHVGRAMTGGDVLLLTLRIDSGFNRPPYMDEVRVGGPTKPLFLVGLNLLGIDQAWYVNEVGFDKDRGEIFSRVRFLSPVAVTIDTAGGPQTVSFAVGDTVLVFRYLFLDEEGVLAHLSHGGLRVRLSRRGESDEVLLVAATRAD